MAEIDILGKVISKDVEDQLDRIILKTKDVVDSITKLNSVSSGAGSAGGGGSRGGGKSKAEFDAATQAVNELVKARQKLTTAEQYDYAEVVRLRTERAKLIAQLKEEALALEGKSKAQKKAAIESEKALKEQIKLNEKATIEAKKLADEQVKANAKAAAANEKYQNKLIDLEIKKEEALKKSNARTADIIERRIQKESEQADRRIQKELAAAEKLAQAQRRSSSKQGFALSPEQQSQGRVDKSGQDEKLKLAAIAASQYTTQLQKLDAQIRLLAIDMDSKFNPQLEEQSMEYRELYAQQSKLKESYQRLSRATGQMGSSSKSAYGSFFQMTQVMRELPNFAIDARIGFMALSNNLPMLADEFKAVRQQIIDTEGAAGSSMKTWKALGKSLLSMNTIMIVASTLLVLFGDDILEVAEKLWNGGDATKYFSEQLSKMQTDVFGKMAEDATKITQFSLDYYAARKKGDKEIIKSLEEKGNKEFGLHKEQLNMIAENINNWRTAFSEYIKMAQITYQNEFRLKAGAEAEFNAKRAAVQRDQAEEDLRAYLKTKFKDAPGGMSANDRINMTIDNMKAGKTTGLIKIAGELEDRWAAAQTEVSKFNDELEELKKINVTAVVRNIKPDKPKKSGSSGTTQDGSDMLVDPQAYNEERADVVKKLSKLELQTQQNTTDGVIQAFASREAAATAYYENQVKLIAIDKDIALQESRDKLENDKTQLENTQKQNEKLFSTEKITKVRMNELRNQFKVAMATLDSNQLVKEKEIIDKSSQQAIDAEIAKQSTLLQIRTQAYQQSAELIDINTAQQSTKADTAGAEKASSIKKQGVGDIIQKVTGGKDYGDEMDLLKNERDTELQKSIIRQNGIKFKLAQVKKGSEEERKLKLDLDAEIRADADKGREYERKMTEEAESRKYDLQVQTAEMAIETMKELSEAFFEWQKEMIDKQLSIDTKRQEEKVAQFEDETKAGMHTQEDLEKFKERSTAYQTSLDEEAAKKKEELDKKAFLMGQAFALGQIWINYAINSSKEGINPVTQAWLLVSAIAGTALVAAQTIPAFAEGGVMGADGKAILGDGNKHELVVDPRGNFFISDNKSGLYDLKGGSQIFPDVNKLDIEKVLGLKKNSATSNEQKLNELTVLRSIERAIKTQKQGNFYGMPLVRQLNNSERYASRKRGLIK
jgi:hypothetical protein